MAHSAMDIDATLPNSSLQIRQKRVLPSRSRRGGPGVGNCDVDVMILNAQLNKSENEPLIPADTLFVLKTNDTLERVAGEFSSAGGSGLNLHAHESYFDRPDVLKAYREQTIIETPEYQNVADTPSVGGRLRVRTSEENNNDTDAAYEKRHRKYESFEKRQRLREKEKLKHEQYKLKERIEQLRAMDNSAFLAAPASSFSPRPGVLEVVEEDPILGGLNGNPAYLEGERRRKEMLMNAQALEERYRVLLPPDRQRKPAGQNSMNVSIDPDSELSGKEFARPHDDGESEFDDDYGPHVSKKETQKLKLKLPARPSVVTPPVTTPKAPSASSKKRRRSPPPFIPPKSPAVRRPRLGPDMTPLTMGRHIMSTGEPGPSLLVEPFQANSELLQNTSMPRPDMDVVTNLRFIQYDSPADPHKPVKQRARRSVHKRAKTEERGPPSPRDHSVPHPEQYIVVDEEPVSPKRSSSPIHDTTLSYSYPPPPPPGDDYPSPETTIPPADAVSPGPVSPLESDPGPNDFSNDFSASNDYSASLHPIHPPSPPAEEASLSVPPSEPIEMERKPSVPPIESISAPVVTVSRRGRSRAAPKPVTRRAPKRRTTPPCALVSFSERTAKNPRQLEHNRHLGAFGVKLPPIIHNSGDSYDFELPPEIFAGPDYEDRAQDADVTQEVEGSQGPDDTDDLETAQDQEGPDEPLEPVDDPADDTDEDLDGT